jgi:predicted RNA-binding Zn ribbon-like protein
VYFDGYELCREAAMSQEIETVERIPMVGGELCLDFTNTTSERDLEPRERLLGYGDLLVWAERTGLIDARRASDLRAEAEIRPRDAARVHARALELREAIYRVFSAVAAGEPANSADVAWLDAEVREAQRRRRLVAEGDGVGWAWVEEGDPLEGILRPVAWSAAELLTSDAVSRVKECSNDHCNWLFVDVSRNRSRRWCDMKDCGNRAKARRHYARQRAHAE